MRDKIPKVRYFAFVFVMKSSPVKLAQASLIALPALLLVAIGATADDSRSDAFATLGHYPQSEAFTVFVASHRNYKSNPSNLFYSTWFSDGRPSVAMKCSIARQGKTTTEREVYNWAIQASHVYLLKPTQITALRAALRELPASAKNPELKNLLILSYRGKAQWTTRIYDKSNLPPAVERVYKITKAPLN